MSSLGLKQKQELLSEAKSGYQMIPPLKKSFDDSNSENSLWVVDPTGHRLWALATEGSGRELDFVVCKYLLLYSKYIDNF
jgi:hypothetical protein